MPDDRDDLTPVNHVQRRWLIFHHRVPTNDTLWDKKKRKKEEEKIKATLAEW